MAIREVVQKAIQMQLPTFLESDSQIAIQSIMDKLRHQVRSQI